jgi:hypothetical protein
VDKLHVDELQMDKWQMDKWHVDELRATDGSKHFLLTRRPSIARHPVHGILDENMVFPPIDSQLSGSWETRLRGRCAVNFKNVQTRC